MGVLSCFISVAIVFCMISVPFGANLITKNIQRENAIEAAGDFGGKI